MGPVAYVKLVIASLLVFVTVTPVQAQDERRLALVIGVDDYSYSPLKNPVRDADLVARSLRRINFEVTLLPNPTKGEFRQAVDKLYQKARDGSKNATIFIYFAGHGVQVAQENYLIPSKADLQGRALTYADFDDQAVHAQWILRKLSETGVTRLIFALDACRDNPLLLASDLDAGTGLAKMSAIGGGPDTLILYATQPGRTASDGTYSNSPFSEALASTLAVPGQSTQDLIGVVSEKVEGQTKGKQKPYFEGSLRYVFLKRDVPVVPGSGVGWPMRASLLEQSRIDGPERGALLTLELLKTRTLADLERQSSNGDGFASYVAGMAHWEGLGGANKNSKTAARFMQLGVSQGSLRATNALGQLYCCDDQFQRDLDTAIGWFEVAAKGGSVFAMRNLGLELTTGDTPRDLKAGMDWLDQAAQKGNAEAFADMAAVYNRRNSANRDPAKALELYEKSFDAGNPFAAYELGNGFRWGWTIASGRVDFDRAMQYYLDGAASGCNTCWEAAGDMLSDPQNAERFDAEGALALYKAGHEAGDHNASIRYGNLLRKGAGTFAPDPAGALETFRSAAAAGSLDGRRAFAIAVAKGQGTTRDIVKAAPELRELLRNVRHTDLNVRHAIYDPEYWDLAKQLILGLKSGEIEEEYQGEQAALIARYGLPDDSMRRFTVPVVCGESKVSFHIYIGNWDRPNDETIEGQAAWLKQMRGCDFPQDVIDSFRAIKKKSRENSNTKFTELAATELGGP